ncbi:MAG: glutamine synthetase family protein [Lachnospiraceae bacterium]|nr:glutamine synthetase family protein [Lachnospiraceae bacterium]
MITPNDILTTIEEEDVEFIRLQFTDIWGNLKNIAVTPKQMDKVFKNKFSFEGRALFDDLLDCDEDFYLYPDPETFVILPWRPQQGKVGKIICDVCHSDGTPCALSPRQVLKESLERARKAGYTFRVNAQCEFFLFHTDENGNPTTLSHEKAGYLDVGPSDFGENARRDMVLTLEEMGFEIESSHHEKAPAQHEIDFMADDALKTADNVMTFKFAVRSIAKRFGLYATFMPKPVEGVEGSGMHLNFSMYKDGKNLFETGDKGDISKEAACFIGGVMAHAKGLCAVTNPIINSYKRIISGFKAPSLIDWSTKGENSLIKYHNKCEEAKVELRFPDPAANPYLAIAACINAGLDGISKNTEPTTGRPKKLPENLSEALDSMVRDYLVVKTLGEELSDIYIKVKKDEWKRYMSQVSDWEINNYLSKM